MSTCAHCGTVVDGAPGCWYSRATGREVCETSPTTFHEAGCDVCGGSVRSMERYQAVHSDLVLSGHKACVLSPPVRPDSA